MNNNDILRRLRFALDLSDPRLAEIFALGGIELTPLQARARLGREEDEGAVFCENAELEGFLDGLIVERRGPPPQGRGPSPWPMPLTNNEVLKKLRIALKLRNDDILEMLAAGGQPMGKAELSAIMRRPDHRHFRLCGDQALRKFLAGLSQRLRPDVAG
jgi:uncharacterized protein YehS (DUF1456 family)